MFLKLRAHIHCVEPDELRIFMQSVAEVCEKFIVYRHPKEETERDHIHALLYKTTLSEKVARDWCHIKLKLEKSNKNYSVGTTYGKKKVKISEHNYKPYISYMSKGQWEPLYNKGFPDDEIDGLRRAFSPESTVVNLSQPIEKIEKRVKLTQFQIAREALILYEATYGDEDTDYYKLGKIVVQVLRKNGSLAHYTVVANIMQDIQSERFPDTFMTAVLARIKI